MAKGDIEKYELPFWQDIKTRWYARLIRLSRQFGITRVKLLEEALDLYERSKRTLPFKKANVSEDAVHKVMGSYPKSWWASLSPEDRDREKEKRSKGAREAWKKRKREG